MDTPPINLKTVTVKIGKMKFSLATPKKPMTLGLVAFLCLLIIWFSTKSPSNLEDWQIQYRVLPTVHLEKDSIHIKNVRDFRYNDDATISKQTYIDKEFRLSEFVAAWYGISHFGDHGLAHVLMSFEFENDEFLVVSIEARLETKHVNGYSPVKGLFRNYTKTVVLATEQDVIGLRTHVRGEPLYLYKLDVPELYTKPLLLNFLREAQVLNNKPTFYNTILDNCMTGLLAQSDQFNNLSSWLDTRILLPGNSDEIAYELGYINNNKPFTKARKNALIDPQHSDLEDEDFSRRIRQ